MKLEENKDFELVDLPKACADPEIKQEDFVLAQTDNSVHETKFQTKPTTFLKDSIKRFRKNKSSVVAAYILGFLILLSIVVPAVSPAIKESEDLALFNLGPKLFNAGSGFWDGTSNEKHVPINSSSSDRSEWLPDQTIYKIDGISNLTYGEEEYTDVATGFGHGGYAEFGYYSEYDLTEAYLTSRDISALGSANNFTIDFSVTTVTLSSFKAVNEAGLKATDSELEVPENFEIGLTSLQFVYRVNETDDDTFVEIVAPASTHDIGGMESTVNVSDIIRTKTGMNYFQYCYFALKVEGTTEQIDRKDNVCALVESLNFELSENANEKQKNYFLGHTDETSKLYIPGISFTDANAFMCRTTSVSAGNTKLPNLGYWYSENPSKNVRGVYRAKCVYGDFVYDAYKGQLGTRTLDITSNKIEDYVYEGYMDVTVEVIKNASDEWIVNPATFYCEILNPNKCPLQREFTIEDITIVRVIEIGPTREVIYTLKDFKITYYKYLGYEKMPTFLFGTDKTGKDMFVYVFDGLRNSLLLGVVTFIVCFLFGLMYGAISGYFGGTVDLVMERITDILSGVPWIVVMTLVILKSDSSSFGTFALALCLTGWIGTAATTRTQFYRFRGREYVLASRTLGSSDARLIVKHILPNAMGTIITGAVLMIPSVIFSEATISYLGLGFKNLSSLGVILSNNQNELVSHPYQLLFPSAVIALVMISFNLFGNGLRDAINPSLKGEEE